MAAAAIESGEITLNRSHGVSATERRTRRRFVGMVAAVLALPYLVYRALWAEPMHSSSLVPLTVILIALFVVYATHCFRILRRRQTDRLVCLHQSTVSWGLFLRLKAAHHRRRRPMFALIREHACTSR